MAPDDFRSLAGHLIRNCEADAFLSGSGFPGHDNYYMGVDPTDELKITEKTRKSALSDFAFSDNRPVFGFLSYPYGVGLNGITPRITNSFPMGIARKYKYYFTYNEIENTLKISGDSQSIPDTLLKGLTAAPENSNYQPKAPSDIRQSLTRDEYIDGVEQTLEYIRSGYIYQLNLTLEYSAQIPDFDAVSFFLKLWKTFPAPYYAWYNCGRYQVFSTSPERFLKVDRGSVRSEPIKGTLHIQNSQPELVERLTASPKESAELSMIVDMVRNDISKNCEYGSVQIADHKSVFRVDNLLQMYTPVTGTLKKGKTCVDLLLDAFPGASVTGCPKKKAIEIINQLEPHSRDIYCGTFFQIEDELTMDSSITIRSGYFDRRDAILHFYAGSGIVADSIPENEYAETIAKAEKFLRLLT